MERKEFLRMSCAALGLGILGSAATGCMAYKVIKTSSVDGLISIPLSEFALESTKLVRVAGSQYDILVRKLGEGQFRAVLMKCTHQDWAITAGKSTINCTYHGSAFDLDGKVITGPAEKSLQSFKTKIENEFLLLS